MFSYGQVKILAVIAALSFCLILSGCGRSDSLVLSGTIESTQVNIISEVSGKIIKLEKEEGANIKKGDTLAIVDASLQELAVKQQEAVVKLKQLKLDELKSFAGNEQIRQAEADLEQSKALLDQAKLILSKYQIKSPIDGTYLYRNINIGDIVSTGTNIGVVSDLTDLWVKVYIPQRYLRLISLNQELELKSSSLPDRTIKGSIVYIASEAEFTPKNTETREAKENTVFKVKIKIVDNLESLRPGMTVDAIIPTAGI